MRSQPQSVHESDEVPVSQSGCENSRIKPHVALLELCPEVCFLVFKSPAIIKTDQSQFYNHSPDTVFS